MPPLYLNIPPPRDPIPPPTNYAGLTFEFYGLKDYIYIFIPIIGDGEPISNRDLTI